MESTPSNSAVAFISTTVGAGRRSDIDRIREEEMPRPNLQLIPAPPSSRHRHNGVAGIMAIHAGT